MTGAATICDFQRSVLQQTLHNHSYDHLEPISKQSYVDDRNGRL